MLSNSITFARSYVKFGTLVDMGVRGDRHTDNMKFHKHTFFLVFKLSPCSKCNLFLFG